MIARAIVSHYYEQLEKKHKPICAYSWALVQLAFNNIDGHYNGSSYYTAVHIEHNGWICYKAVNICEN